MKKSFRLLSFTLLFALACGTKAQDKTDVLVVATIHNNHAVSKYSYNDLLRILDTYKPDLICVEIRPVDFRTGTLYLREMTLATLYGDLNGIKVEPIDWWDDKDNDRIIRDSLSKQDYYIGLLSKQDSLIKNDPDIQAFNKKYGENVYKNNQLDVLFWNGTEYSDYNWHNYKISLDVFGDSPFNLHYITRNRNMLHLINEAIVRNKSRRVVILTGGEHKRFFDDSLQVQQNIRNLSLDNILPLNNSDVSRVFMNELPSVYYGKNVSDEAKENFYSGSCLPLVHGMGMDFYPSVITENSIKEFKFILDHWKKEIPESIRLNYELGWYNFLIGNYDNAVDFLNKYIETMDSSKSASALPFSKGIAFTLIAKCYDLEGKREEAIAGYNKSISQLESDKQGRLVDYLVSPYLKEPYKR